MEYLFWALAGWCGTPWRRRWPWPWPPGPDPDPRGPHPEPWGPSPDPWIIIKVLGIVGGIVGGIIFDRVFDGTPLPARSVGWMAATSFGALILGRVVSEVGSLVIPSGARANTRG